MLSVQNCVSVTTVEITLVILIINKKNLILESMLPLQPQMFLPVLEKWMSVAHKLTKSIWLRMNILNIINTTTTVKILINLITINILMEVTITMETIICIIKTNKEKILMEVLFLLIIMGTLINMDMSITTIPQWCILLNIKKMVEIWRNIPININSKCNNSTCNMKDKVLNLFVKKDKRLEILMKINNPMKIMDILHIWFNLKKRENLKKMERIKRKSVKMENWFKNLFLMMNLFKKMHQNRMDLRFSSHQDLRSLLMKMSLKSQ